MTEDPEATSIDLANDFLEAEWMMEIVKYMKSEIDSLMRKQEALEFANPPRLRKFPRLLDQTNSEIESECLTSEHTNRIDTREAISH